MFLLFPYYIIYHSFIASDIFLSYLLLQQQLFHPLPFWQESLLFSVDQVRTMADWNAAYCFLVYTRKFLPIFQKKFKIAASHTPLMRLIPGSELLLIFCAILQYRNNIFIIRKVKKIKGDAIRMETEQSWQEKEARRRRLSEKIGAALMAGSMIWTPGGPLSWAFVLGGRNSNLSTGDILCTGYLNLFKRHLSVRYRWQ